MTTPAPSAPHAFLARLAGAWTGTARTWFEANDLADTSPLTATIEPILDGRFAMLRYEGTLTGEPMVGLALLGYEVVTGWEMSWVDSVHNGTAIMHSTNDGTGGDELISVLGSYRVGRTEVRWGWRTRISLDPDGRLVILHRNIPPAGEGEEYDGVEFVLTRA